VNGDSVLSHRHARSMRLIVQELAPGFVIVCLVINDPDAAATEHVGNHSFSPHLHLVFNPRAASPSPPLPISFLAPRYSTILPPHASPTPPSQSLPHTIPVLTTIAASFLAVHHFLQGVSPIYRALSHFLRARDGRDGRARNRQKLASPRLLRLVHSATALRWGRRKMGCWRELGQLCRRHER